jgi:hypothetical protein
MLAIWWTSGYDFDTGQCWRATRRRWQFSYKLGTVLSFVPITPLTVFSYWNEFMESGSQCIKATFRKLTTKFLTLTQPPQEITRGVLPTSSTSELMQMLAEPLRGVMPTKHNTRSYRVLLNGASVVLSVEAWCQRVKWSWLLWVLLPKHSKALKCDNSDANSSYQITNQKSTVH